MPKPKDSTRGPEVNPFRLLSQAGFHASAVELYKATVTLVELAADLRNEICGMCDGRVCANCPCASDPCPMRDLSLIIYRGEGFQP